MSTAKLHSVTAEELSAQDLIMGRAATHTSPLGNHRLLWAVLVLSESRKALESHLKERLVSQLLVYLSTLDAHFDSLHEDIFRADHSNLVCREIIWPQMSARKDLFGGGKKLV